MKGLIFQVYIIPEGVQPEPRLNNLFKPSIQSQNSGTQLPKMPKHDQSDSESEEPREKSSSEEEELEETNNGSNNQEASEYEKQRLSRIRENKARMEAMGLRNMAFKMMGSVEKQKKMKKGKGKEKAVEEDEEYKPCEGDDDLSSESDEDGGDGDGDDDYDDEFVGGKGSGSRRRKVKSNKNSKSKKKASVKKLPRARASDFIDDDDEELMQAIALSLKDSGVSNTVDNRPSQSGGVKTVDPTLNERKGNAHIQEDTGRRKRKKPVTSRVQMTEDELIMHFFQFDEAGKGSINLRDLQRVSNTHDFVWTDREMADMIFCFDSDGDGKLSLDDFRGIVSRCNMIKGSENALPVSKS